MGSEVWRCRAADYLPALGAEPAYRRGEFLSDVVVDAVEQRGGRQVERAQVSAVCTL